jgi:hypothetical protein
MARTTFSAEDVLCFLLGADEDARIDDTGLGELPRVFRGSEVCRSVNAAHCYVMPCLEVIPCRMGYHAGGRDADGR